MVPSVISAHTSSASQIALIKLCALTFVFSGLLWQYKVGRWGRRLYWLAAVAVTVLYCADLVMMMRTRIDLNVEWDFLNYWLVGRIAAEDLPIYEAASYLRQSLPFWPSMQFFSQVIFVGTLYAPPAVLMLLPLGYMEYREAFIVWSVVQAVLLAAVAVLIKREFFHGGFARSQATAWLAVTGLMIFFPPVIDNLESAQVNLIIAGLFMLLWRTRSNLQAGVWIGLGMCIKPYFGILVFWLFLRNRFGTIVLVAVTGVLAFACAALVLGASNVSTYLLDNPLARAPAELYTWKVNVSALGILRRALGDLEWVGSPVMYGPYITFALLVTAITGWSILRSSDDRWALIACVALGLIIAPQSIHHYSTVLLPAMAFLLVYSGFKWLGVIAVIALYTLDSFQGAGFWLNLSVWLIAVSHPWWSEAFTGTPASPQRSSLLGSLIQRLRKKVSKNRPGTSGPT